MCRELCPGYVDDGVDEVQETCVGSYVQVCWCCIRDYEVEEVLVLLAIY